MSASPIEVLLTEPRTRRVSTGVYPAATSAVLLLADTAAILTAMCMGVSLWRLVNPSVTMSNYFDIWVSLGLFVAVFQGFSLYAASGLSPVEELRRTVLATALVSLALTATAFLAKEIEVYSRGALLASSVLVAFLVPAARAAVRCCFASRSWWGVPVLIFGAGKTAALLISRLNAQPGLGLKPVACLDDDDSKYDDCLGVPVLGPLSAAPALARSLRIRHAVVAMPGVERSRLVGILERYGAPFASLLVVPNLFGMASLWVTTRDIGGVLGLEVRRNLLVPFNLRLKRALDCVIGLPLFLISLPLLACLAAWIKLASPGPAFFRQTREGRDGSRIRIWKLRTMHVNAEELLDQHLDAHPAERDVWRRFYKLEHDPRVIPGVGHLLRRFSLDELPQLWNVLAGQMSLVGPRPFPYYHLESFSPEFRSLRRSVPPGLTGLWQVSDRSNGALDVQEAQDTYYIRNWSLWLDLYLLAATVKAVVTPNGAY